MGFNWEDLPDEVKERLAASNSQLADLLEEERDLDKLREEVSISLEDYHERVKVWKKLLRNPSVLKMMLEGSYKPL